MKNGRPESISELFALFRQMISEPKKALGYEEKHLSDGTILVLARRRYPNERREEILLHSEAHDQRLQLNERGSSDGPTYTLNSYHGSIHTAEIGYDAFLDDLPEIAVQLWLSFLEELAVIPRPRISQPFKFS